MFLILTAVFLAVLYGILLCLAYYRTEKHIIGSTVTSMLDKCMNTRTCMNKGQPEASIIGKYKLYILFQLFLSCELAVSVPNGAS